jgi:pimeloyl-ACP methyl ester carboxylesterase
VHAALLHDGCHLSFDVEGAGPPVVFIQGVGVAGTGWRPQVDQLRDGFRCLTFDNRGVGRSQPVGAPVSVALMADDTFALMDHLDWPSAHLVGHSLGGPVALQMALAQPARVRSLSLLCTVVRGKDATRLSWRILWLGLRSRVGPRRARRRAFLQIVMPADMLRRADTDKLAADLAPLFGHDLADQPSIAMPQLSALRAFDATHRLSQLSAVPTLVVSAAHDPIAPPPFGRALAAAIPGARYVEFADAAHGLPIQHAERVNDLLREHFAAAEPPRPEAAVAAAPQPVTRGETLP